MCFRYKAVGKLSGGHQSPIMVMAVDDTDTADGNTCIVTGSKDHYLKVSNIRQHFLKFIYISHLC